MKKDGKLNRIIRSLGGILPGKRSCAAIVVAAGEARRMGDMPKAKPLLPVAGIPVLVRTLRAFEETPGIDYVILVTRGEDTAECEELCAAYSLTKVAAVVPGGATRQESVLEGLCRLDAKTEFVAVHDGARCLVTREMIEKVLSCAYIQGAASAGAPVKDTIKRTDDSGFICETPKRAALWQAQTPQIFRAGLFRAAAYYARSEGLETTDDNSLLERLGGRIQMVDCGYTNIKITTPEDIAIAEAILKSRETAEK